MIFLLERIAAQTASYTITSMSMNSTTHTPEPPAFVTPDWAVRVNGLWFASLIVSLSTASLSMLVKQWLREYLAVEWTSPQERLRARQYRKPALDKWKVFEIAAVLPMLLQVSLGLFFVGLCFFTASVDWRMARTSVSLVSGWAFFVIVTTLLPLCSPRCAYKMPLLKSAMRTTRHRVTMPIRCSLTVLFAQSAAYLHSSIILVTRFRTVLAAQSATYRLRIMVSIRRMLTVVVVRLAACLCSLSALSAQATVNLTRGRDSGQDLRGEEGVVLEGGQQSDHNDRQDRDGRKGNRDLEEEDEFVRGSEDDADILVFTDSIMDNDSLLPTIWDAFKQRTQDSAQSLSFILRLITNRLGEKGDDLISSRIRCIPDLSLLSRRTWDAFMEMLAELARRHPGPLLVSSPDWLHNLTLLLLSASPYPLPESAQSSLGALIDDPPVTLDWERANSIGTWIVRRSGEPEFMFRPVAQRLLPLFEAGTLAQHPSLLTVFQIYQELLRPFCTGSPHSWSLYITLSREQHLFGNSCARPILEDMWDILYANMMFEGHAARDYRQGTVEGLAILLEFGPRIGQEADAAKAFAAFWANRRNTYTALCDGSAALHQRGRTSGAHVLELITRAFLKSEGVPSCITTHRPSH